MSLINKMLRDLEQRNDKAPSPEEPPSGFAVLLRTVPMPVLLGVAAIVLIAMIWWFAGLMSTWMFGFDEVPVAESVQETISEPAMQETSAPAADEEAMEDESSEETVSSDTVDEKVVSEEEIVEEVVVERNPVAIAEPAPAPVKIPASVDQPVAVPVTVEKPAVTPKPRETTLTQAAPRPTAERVTAVTPSRKTAPVVKTRPRPVIKPIPTDRPVHPDQLPGAVLFDSRTPAAKTPFGAADAAYRRGVEAYQANRRVTASRELRRTLDTYPGHLPARELLAEILQESGRTGEAMYLLAEGLELAPDHMPLKKSYARLLTEQGDAGEAARVMMSEGIPAVADDPEAHVLMASIYMELDEPFLAAQTYRNLLVVWPQTGAFWVGLGTALDAQEMPDEAAKAFQQALYTDDLRKDLADYARQRLNQ